jgi:starch-binding outer membrane protein, SusD/RagB family
MRLLKIYSLLLILSLSFGACEKFLGPVNDNHSGIDRVYTDPEIAEGLLISAYTKIPYNIMNSNDVATDDAVTNDKQDYSLRMATGEWSALFNPVSEWDNSFGAILYINKFLSVVDTVPWKWTSEVINSMFIRRLKGEAYALRGLAQYYVLVTTGGVSSTDGELLGIPIIDKFINVGDNFNIPRASFIESVNQIYSDFDKALEYLTMDDYKNVTSSAQLPPGLENVSPSDYNMVFGNVNSQRISGRIVKALKARVALLAASPAFSDGNVTLWETAANYAGASINSIGGISGLDPDGHRFFEPSIVDNVSMPDDDQKEMVWRSAMNDVNYQEAANFPPSLYGRGNINPTQNLVDAFPMENGYPISDLVNSNYDPNDPYADRDPRLSLYIVYNGSSMKGQTILTGVGGGMNAKDSLSTSTRTGYYLRKMLREDVNMNPNSSTTKMHYSVFMRYTEIFLIYAEAANEAWGPDGTGANGFSAKDVIAAIRARAGISQPDNYLTSISSKEDMRQLIRNERRLELCFEGFRFWDLRRWKADLTESAKGINASSLTVVDVELRSYNNDFMHYGPLPKGEILKFNALIQNEGW